VVTGRRRPIHSGLGFVARENLAPAPALAMLLGFALLMLVRVVRLPADSISAG
jgi:hypothetical protein